MTGEEQITLTKELNGNYHSLKEDSILRKGLLGETGNFRIIPGDKIEIHHLD